MEAKRYLFRCSKQALAFSGVEWTGSLFGSAHAPEKSLTREMETGVGLERMKMSPMRFRELTSS